METPGHLEVVLVEALDAFGRDPSYAVAVMTAAVNVRRKRGVWQSRTDLRKAEQEARTRCAEGPDFICNTPTPCGTGTCRFATEEFRRIAEVDSAGSTARPQLLATGGSYSLDGAVAVLYELREGRKV